METINHFQCFDYMIDSANDILDEDFIKNTHKILKTNTSDSRISWFNVGEYISRWKRSRWKNYYVQRMSEI